MANQSWQQTKLAKVVAFDAIKTWELVPCIPTKPLLGVAWSIE